MSSVPSKEDKVKRIESLLEEFFSGDRDKVGLWLKTKNLNFGGCSPNDLILRGREHKVLEFIEDAKSESGW